MLQGKNIIQSATISDRLVAHNVYYNQTYLLPYFEAPFRSRRICRSLPSSRIPSQTQPTIVNSISRAPHTMTDICNQFHTKAILTG
jgi:hypothetical protein